MKKLRIYLDTSVINFLFADDAPEKRDATARNGAPTGRALPGRDRPPGCPLQGTINQRVE